MHNPLSCPFSNNDDAEIRRHFIGISKPFRCIDGFRVRLPPIQSKLYLSKLLMQESCPMVGQASSLKQESDNPLKSKRMEFEPRQSYFQGIPVSFS